MFQLTTSRLRLIPLSYEQLVLLSKSRNELEKQLGLVASQLELNAPDEFLSEYRDALLNFCIPMVKLHEDHYAWYTHWLIVLEDRQLVIGGIGLSGLPDNEGGVMTGYFIDKKFEGQGYATEAVRCLTSWIFKNPLVHKVVADTLIDGRGSQKVLQHNGFQLAGQLDGVLRWELHRSLRKQ